MFNCAWCEITTPGRIYPTKLLLQHEMKNIDYVLSAGTSAAQQLANAINSSVEYVRIPPGVDIERFSFPNVEQKIQAQKDIRKKLGISNDAKLIISISRLVPRKGFDVLIKALQRLEDNVHIVIIGKGRDEKRLKDIASKYNLNS